MTTTTPTTALADLDNTAKEALRDLSHIENHLQESSAPTTVMNRALDVRMGIKELRAALAGRAAQPVAPVGSVLSADQILAAERRSEMSDDEALRWGRVIESMVLRATPSPQIAEVAELPKPYGYAVEHPGGHITFFKTDPTGFRGKPFSDQSKTWAELGTHVRDLFTGDAIAASRRASAPASAGQAAPALVEPIYQVRATKGVWTDVDREIYDQYTGASYERRIVYLAAQPAEGAGQAGQVAMPRNLAQRCLTSMRAAVTFGETGRGRPPAQTCMFEIEELEALLAAPTERAAAPAELTSAARDVLAERRRQVEQEGWTPAHDDEHNGDQLAMAAAWYALPEFIRHALDDKGLGLWPWAQEWWKPKDRRQNLIRAGALILADIECLDRATIASAQVKP